MTSDFAASLWTIPWFVVPGRVPQSWPSEVTMDENCKHLRERAFLEMGKLELRSPFCGVGGS